MKDEQELRKSYRWGWHCDDLEWA